MEAICNTHRSLEAKLERLERKSGDRRQTGATRDTSGDLLICGRSAVPEQHPPSRSGVADRVSSSTGGGGVDQELAPDIAEMTGDEGLEEHRLAAQQ